MNPSKTAILVTLALAVGLMTSCDIWGSDSGIDDDIKSFIETEDLPDAQTPDIRFDDSESKVKAFYIEFGPGCDCPGECFYSRAQGLKFRDRIGWIGVGEASCLQEAVRTRATFFDVKPGDSTLFDDDFQNRFREATRGEDYAYSPIYKGFLQMIARDRDTAVNTLFSLANLLFDERLNNLAKALIENPTVRSNEGLLEKLASLPDWVGYRPVKDEADQLLDQMS